jgi:tetratricopeptide (TPR) repeat protein
MLRVIREQEPTKPSTRLSTAEGLPTLAANRGTEPRRLAALVRGELDWIVLKALEKDRNRRYETASAFAADVQRYLNDEQVLACPPSAWYLLGKFARRNRSRLTAAAVLGVALLAAMGTAAGSIGWVARDRAARQARLTGQVELILEDTDRLERDQKWPEALAAVGRAEAALAGGEAGDAIRRRVATARRDLAFVAELDRIAQERWAVVEGKFNHAGAARDYARAFRAYGVDIESVPVEEAIAGLRQNPALAAPVAMALDDWVEARWTLAEGDSSWKPLVAVARGLDPDPLRDRLRAAWGRPVTPGLQAELLGLAGSIDVKAQRPGTLQVLARTLKRGHLADAALRIRQEGQYAYPADFWLNFDLGYQLSGRKDYAGAVRYFSVAVSLRPDSAPAHTNLGFALYGQGKPDEAVACFKKARELDPKLAAAHYNLGNALRDQGKLDEAIACWKKALEFNPKDTAAYINLGDALSDQGKLDEAVACFRKALEFHPNDALAHNNLGGALSNQGKLDEAIAECREALRLNKDYALAHNNLGLALYRQGKLDEAMASYRKALALDPTPAYQRALDLAIRDTARQKGEDTEARFRLGVDCARRGSWNEAAIAFDRGLEVDPTNQERWYLAAALHAADGDVDGYRRTCRELLKRFGDAGQPQMAERTAKCCLLLPDAVSAADFDRVQKLAERAVTGTENNGYYRFFVLARGLADYRAGRHAEAVRWLERFPLQADGIHWDATKFAVLAMACQRLGRAEEAEAALARAQAILAKMPDPAQGRPFGPRDFHDWLHARILCREAEELLKKESGKEPD